MTNIIEYLSWEQQHKQRHMLKTFPTLITADLQSVLITLFSVVHRHVTCCAAAAQHILYVLEYGGIATSNHVCFM